MYKCKYSRWRVERAIRQMAKKLKKEQLVNDNTTFFVMLNGGVWFSSKLFDALGDLDNAVYYIKGHSYQGKERGRFEWDIMPHIDLKGREVMVIDDICDSGETLKAVYKELHTQCQNIRAVTLLKRLPCTVENEMTVYTCIEDESQDFFVGCGLDDNGKGRLLRYVGKC